jgi:hypothetical protein
MNGRLTPEDGESFEIPFCTEGIDLLADSARRLDDVTLSIVAEGTAAAAIVVWCKNCVRRLAR